MVGSPWVVTVTLEGDIAGGTGCGKANEVALRRPFRFALFVALTVLVVGPGCAGRDDDHVRNESAGRPLVHANGREVLPNWATNEELAVQRTAKAPADLRDSPGPGAGYRIPAEYEPVSAVVMTWAGHTEVLRGIAVAAAAAGADVWMVGGPSAIAGVPAERYKPLPLGFDSIWSRDYGPVGIDEATKALGIVDTTYRHYATRVNDDAMSCRLAEELGGECYPTNLVLDGGNFMTDGHGNVFLTSRVYDWNPSLTRARVNELLRSFLGAERIHIFDYAKTSAGEPLDGTGHIDMFAKLVGDCEVLVAQTTDQPFKTVTEKAASYFEDLACGAGTYEVTRVKAWVDDGVWYTYTNSLIVNKTVVIPLYDNSRDNRGAVVAYRRAMPGSRVVGVNTQSTIVLGGSIHCVTREIPAVGASS